MIHPTKDEILSAIDGRVIGKKCLDCARWACGECTIKYISVIHLAPCTERVSEDVFLLGMAFLMTMPRDIKKSLIGSNK